MHEVPPAGWFLLGVLSGSSSSGCSVTMSQAVAQIILTLILLVAASRSSCYHEDELAIALVGCRARAGCER